MLMHDIARKLLVLSLLSVCALASGCSNREHWMSETYSATGSVTVNGEKAEGAIVMLFPAGEPVDKRNSKPWGQVDADGTYRLGTYDREDGAPVGDYEVTLVWSAGLSPDRLKGAYNSPAKSVMTVTIAPGTNELPPIELENVSVLPAPSGNANALTSGM